MFIHQNTFETPAHPPSRSISINTDRLRLKFFIVLRLFVRAVKITIKLPSIWFRLISLHLFKCYLYSDVFEYVQFLRRTSVSMTCQIRELSKLIRLEKHNWFFASHFNDWRHYPASSFLFKEKPHFYIHFHNQTPFPRQKGSVENKRKSRYQWIFISFQSQVFAPINRWILAGWTIVFFRKNFLIFFVKPGEVATQTTGWSSKA